MALRASLSCPYQPPLDSGGHKPPKKVWLNRPVKHGDQIEPVIPTIVGVIVWEVGFLDVVGDKVSSTFKQTQKHAPFPPTMLMILPQSQVPILNNNSDCQALTDETIKSSMLCAGGDGRGTNKVR